MCYYGSGICGWKWSKPRWPTRHLPRTVKSILGDGNCLFRSFSYFITGSEEQYRRVREVILNHMVDIGHFMLFHHLPSRYTSIDEYIHDTEMDRNFTWGTDIEILTMAHLLNTRVFVYNMKTGVYILPMMWTGL